MEHFPPELITKIVSYLLEELYDARSIIKQLWKFFLTCQQFNNVNLQQIFRSVAIELHPDLELSKDNNINWRTVVNAISYAYGSAPYASNEAIDVARELIEHGMLFPDYENIEYVTVNMVSMPIEEQRIHIREYLKKIPNINMIYKHSNYPQVSGTILFYLINHSAPFDDDITYPYTLLEELLAAGADPNIPALTGDYKPIYDLANIYYQVGWPIISATYRGWHDAVERLLKIDGIAVDVVGGMDVMTSYPNAAFISPIHTACINRGTSETLKNLLKRIGSCSQKVTLIHPPVNLDRRKNPLGFNANQKDVTALHLACIKESYYGEKVARPDLECIRILVENGADVNAQTRPDECTPLHMLFAAVNNELEHNKRIDKRTVGFDLRAVVKFLVQEQKADLTLENSDGKRVLDYAIMVQNNIDVSQSILDLLI